MRMESFYGKMTVPPNVKFDNRNLTITDLKSDFPESLRNNGLGLPLTEEEKILAEDEPRRGEDDESLYSVTNFSI